MSEFMFGFFGHTRHGGAAMYALASENSGHGGGSPSQSGGSDLHAARQRAVNAFDALWRSAENSRRARDRAHAWLARKLGIARRDCCIERFDAATCQRVEQICRRGGPA